MPIRGKSFLTHALHRTSHLSFTHQSLDPSTVATSANQSSHLSYPLSSLSFMHCPDFHGVFFPRGYTLQDLPDLLCTLEADHNVICKQHRPQTLLWDLVCQRVLQGKGWTSTLCVIHPPTWTYLSLLLQTSLPSLFPHQSPSHFCLSQLPHTAPHFYFYAVPHYLSANKKKKLSDLVLNITSVVFVLLLINH